MTLSTIVNLNNASPQDIRKILGSDSIVVLVGAGISCWEPTTLPTGQDLTRGLYNSLFKDSRHPVIDRQDLKKLEILLNDIPFELLMENCPAQNKIRTVLANLFSSRKPNKIHKILVKLVNDGFIQSIITTNYDLALDEALKKCHLHKIVQKNQATISTNQIYFKIHGSSDIPDSMVFSLNHEAKLPKWKLKILKKVIYNRVLLIIGYSGFDFEVCPEIAQCSPKSVVWNFFSNNSYNRSPGFMHLRNSKFPRFVLLGNMLRLFELIGYPVNPKRYSFTQVDVTSMLQNKFSSKELLLWRTRLLNTMGNSRLALFSINALRPTKSVDENIVTEYAQALFHQGKYYFAGKEFLRVADLSRGPYKKINRELDACDSFRCFGDYKKAYLLLKKISMQLNNPSMCNPKLESKLLIKKLLLLYDFYKIIRKVRLPFISNYLKRKASMFIEKGAPLSLKNGRWLEFQQYRFWLERFNIDLNVLYKQSCYPPLPTRDGYKHLGYQIALLMNLCDRGFKNKKIKVRDLDEGILLSEYLGSHPSCWKIARVGLRLHQSNRDYWKKILKRHFQQCEYSWIKRLEFHLMNM